MKIKDEQILKDIQEGCRLEMVKVSALGMSKGGMLRRFFGDTITNKGFYSPIEGNYLSTDVKFEFAENQTNQKARIVTVPKGIVWTSDARPYHELEKRTGVTRSLVQVRIQIILGIALASVMERATYALYLGHEYKKNIHHHVHHETLKENLPTGFFDDNDSIETKIKRAFEFFWFNDMNDYTGRDLEIKRFSLTHWDKIK